MRLFRKLYRSILFLLLLVSGTILTTLFLRNTVPPHGFSSKIITIWLGLAAKVFGVKITTYGTARKTNTLFVANHISWLDILVIGSLVPLHFLSKHEVKVMPVFGWLATRAGTLYIKRGNKQSASEATAEITKVLKQQHNSLVFAEGTTTDGNIRKFHGRMLQSAIDANAMVQPIAIFYPRHNTQTKQVETNPAALFVGDTSAGESMDLIIREARIEVDVHFLEPIEAAGETRDTLALHAFEEVDEAIQKIKNDSP